MMPFILFLAALALRLYAALVPGIIVPDGILYINTAKMIEAGEWGRVAQHSFYNLYPFLIVIFHKMVPGWELSGRILSVLSGSLAVVPFYWTIKRIFDARLALVASIFFIISPRLVEYSSNVIREPVFWCFSLSALCAAARGLQEKQGFFMALSALFVGLSAFTRMEGLALIPVVMFWACWQYRVEKLLSVKKLLVFLIVFLVSFPILFLSPLLLLKGMLGHWELGHIGSKIPRILSVDNDQAKQTFQNSLDESDIITRAISGNKYLVFLWQPIFKFFRSYHVIFVLLFIVGIVRRKIVPFNRREVLFWFWWVTFFAVSILYVSRIYYLSTRHGMLMGLPGLLWVAIGFYELVGLFDKWGIRTRFAVIDKLKNGPGILLMVVLCAVMLPSTLSWSGLDKVEMKEAGIYLRNNGYGKDILAVEPRINRLAFYTDAEFVTIPENVKAPELGEFFRLSRATLLVVDQNTMGSQLSNYIQTTGKQSLRAVHIDEFRNYHHYSINVYRILR